LWKIGAVIVAIIVVVAAVMILNLPEERPNTTKEITVIDTDGNTIRLSDWDGEIIYLDFMGSGYLECKNNAESVLVPLYQGYSSRMKMLSLSITDADTNQDLNNFKAATRAQWSFALDTDGAKEKYQVTDIPTGFLIDTKGIIVYYHAGKDTYANLKNEVEEVLAESRYKDFTVTDTDSNVITLSNWVSSREVIYLDFFQSTCGHCIANTKNVLFPLYENYSTEIKMLSVSIRDADTVPDLISFKIDNNAAWQFALDTDGAQEKYGVTGSPTGFLIDRDGFIVYQHRGEGSLITLKAEIEEILKGE